VGGRLGLGETDPDKMSFPALSLKEAVGIFTEAAYGKRLEFRWREVLSCSGGAQDAILRHILLSIKDFWPNIHEH
jgi:hypothetical protein